MWSHERPCNEHRSNQRGSNAQLRSGSRWVRLGAALGLAALTAGCFQPLYGDRSVTGGPGVGPALAAVEIMPIDAPPATPLARLAVEVRNELTFALNQGGASPSPTHRLRVNLGQSGSSLIVDPNTARAEYETVNLDATYQLIEVTSGKAVMQGSATSRSTFDVPGQQQRFGRLRGQRDAQSRAAEVIAEQIRNRLASYMATGT